MIKKEVKKDVVLPPIRVSSLELDKIKVRADIVFPDNKGRNLSKYIMKLINSDINKVDIKESNSSNKKDLSDEIRFFAIQLSKIGNNLNQISHSMNVIKKKSFVTIEEKRSFDKHYLMLSNIQKQTALLKEILNDLKK